MDFAKIDWSTAKDALLSDAGRIWLHVTLLIVVGIPTIYWLSAAIRRRVAGKYAPHYGMLAGKLVFYGGSITVIVSILMKLGVELTPLLGAAGIVGIAIGFASQTSVSNIISGLFLLAEKPFMVDDVVTIGDTTGLVLSIDLLSVKIRTFDNRFVRIPNESIIKNQVTNVSRFPIRRIDIDLSVAYKEDLARVHAILMELAHRNPLCLEEPAPVVITQGFGEVSVNLLFTVWAAKEDWLSARNRLFSDIVGRFRTGEVAFPVPERHYSADQPPAPPRAGT